MAACCLLSSQSPAAIWPIESSVLHQLPGLDIIEIHRMRLDLTLNRPEISDMYFKSIDCLVVTCISNGSFSGIPRHRSPQTCDNMFTSQTAWSTNPAFTNHLLFIMVFLSTGHTLLCAGLLGNTNFGNARCAQRSAPNVMPLRLRLRIH